MPALSPSSGATSRQSRLSPPTGNAWSSVSGPRERSGSINAGKAGTMAVIWTVGLMCGIGLSSLGSMKDGVRTTSVTSVEPVVGASHSAKAHTADSPQYLPASVSDIAAPLDHTKRTKPRAPHFVSAFFRHWGLAAGRNPDWALTPPGGVVIDVGANDGMDYAIPAVKHGRKIVFSFEPTPSAIHRLLANAQNAKIPITHIVPTPGQPFNMDIIRSTRIDRSQGHLFLIQSRCRQRDNMVIAPADQMSYVSSSGVHLDFTDKAPTVDVALLRIDEVVPTDVFGEIYLFKSDAQGYDLNVFLGAEGLFRDGRVEFATTEFTPKVMELFREGSAIELLDFLYRYNFLCFDWAAHQHIPRDRPGAFEPYLQSFFEACGDDKGCSCQDDFCFKQSLGKWEELLCVGLDGGARDGTQRIAAQA